MLQYGAVEVQPSMRTPVETHRPLAEWAFERLGHKPWPSELSRTALLLDEYQEAHPESTLDDLTLAAFTFAYVCRVA